MPSPFLLSIAGLSVTLAGFSGLVSAFRRGAELKPIDAFRLRQIPEMGLATALIALASFPLTESVGSVATAVSVLAAVAFVFTLAHGLLLVWRARAAAVPITRSNWWGAVVIDLLILVVTLVTLILGGVGLLEWMFVLMLARPMLAFILVVAAVSAK